MLVALNAFGERAAALAGAEALTLRARVGMISRDEEMSRAMGRAEDVCALLTTAVALMPQANMPARQKYFEKELTMRCD